MDEFDEQAEALLPCDCDGFILRCPTPVHTVICAAYYRSAVAARLREQVSQARAEIERLTRCCEIAEQTCDKNEQEIIALSAKLEAALAKLSRQF